MAVAYTNSMNQSLTDGMVDGKVAKKNPNRGGVVESTTEQYRSETEGTNYSAIGIHDSDCCSRAHKARQDVPSALPPQHNLPSPI